MNAHEPLPSLFGRRSPNDEEEVPPAPLSGSLPHAELPYTTRGEMRPMGKKWSPLFFCSPIPDNWVFWESPMPRMRDVTCQMMAWHVTGPGMCCSAWSPLRWEEVATSRYGAGEGGWSSSSSHPKRVKNCSWVSPTQPLLAGVGVSARPGWWRLSPSRTKKPPGGCRARQPRDRSEYVGVLGNAVYRTGPRRRHLWLV